ncbi:zf-HC2 domain-containing protein [Promicromonospora sukumoe]|uniref:zf-HC2 domain-containing protein n=1 Tax=Promicromonospora sukumoe TaxID=88382 RepID=UPI000365FAF5|nr:zf-HC2 domain-containing protein [Promicromonospora sukumoe]
MTTTGARQAEVARLRTALAGLSGPPAAGPAAEPTAAPGAAGPRAAAGRPECRSTRASIHDYLSGRLLPHRRRRLEKHLDGCAECIRAFIDVRQVSWNRSALDRRLVADDHRGGRHRRPPRRRVRRTDHSGDLYV